MESLKTQTDEQLVTLYAKGNNNAFDVLLYRYKNKIYSYIHFTVHNEALADDLFQETFVKAIIRIQKGKYVESGKFSAWIIRIAHNLIMDQFRIEKGENTVSNDEIGNDLFNDTKFSELDIESQIANEQTIRDLNRLVKTLPGCQREVVYMRFYQNLSFKEIADITGVSINTALGRLRYALLKMKRTAEENHISLTIY
ncbi:MAG: sigma-70 family RNA polymerase sigma factor [Bacteroidaceae bacterium]